MPYSSDAQRKFFHTDTAKKAGITGAEVKEFDQASKGKELPEHVKKMDEGGIAEPDDKKFATEIGQGITEGINHDSDAVKSYLSSKFHSLMTPTEDNVTTSSDTAKMSDGGYAEGGFPHVTFLENESPAKVKEDTHMEGHKAGPMDTTETGEKSNHKHEEANNNPPKMAEGGTIHKAEDRNKEPARPKDVEMSHEKKLNSIYKAMGIKKYADGGVATSDATAQGGPPNPSDPTYWDQIKAALSQAGSATQNALGLGVPPMPSASPQATNPNLTNAIQTGVASGASAAVAPLNPTGTPPSLPSPDAMNAAGLGHISTGATPITPAAPHNTIDLNSIPPPVAPLSTGKGMASAPPAGSPDLKNLFNQDTSKLTQGVNPEDRQALANKLQTQQHGLGAVLAQAVAGLGDALAAKGGKEQHALGNIFTMQKEQRAEALANFDKARQDRLQKLDLQTKMGQNTVQGLAAQDAYGVDERLNKMLGAPTGTAHKDLPLYFQMKTAGVAQKEKDEELYMKAQAQGAIDVDNSIKNATFWGIKPTEAQIQAKGQQLGQQYFNRAKGNVLITASDGGQHWIPAANIGKAQQIDPELKVQP